MGGMARRGKAQRILDRAHEHRETIERLLANADHLRDWFRDWAESQLRRDRFYIYSDAEHSVLSRA
jgi:crotonobetainyl-CoA:carnitine CoA-transferase CaiB-like acyl-CoA transferase